MNNLATDFSIRKDILHIAFPVLFIQLAVFGRIFIATYVMNQVNAQAIASFAVGIGIIQTITMVIIGLLSAISIINTHQNNISTIFSNYFLPYIVISFIIISIISFLLFIFPKFSDFFKISPELQYNVNLFLCAYIIGIPAFVFSTTLRFHLLSFKKTKIISITNINGFIICALFTIIFSWHPFHMGASGFAYAAALSFWYTLFHLLYFTWKNKLLPKTLKNMRLKFHYIIEILKEGVPMSLVYSVESVFFTVLILVTQKYAIEYITSYQIVIQIILLFLIWPLAVGQGAIIIIGQNYSNKTIKINISKIIKNMLLIGISIITLSIVLIFILKQYYLKFFFTEQRFINISILYIYPMLVFLLTDSCAIMFMSVLRGLRKTVFPLISMLIFYWIIGGAIIMFLHFYTHYSPISFFWALSFVSTLCAISYFLYMYKIISSL
ncbi:MATE family efflux transporter [Rickettsiales endosymbiont of Trichoplax sp. H2]|uniref:MATE family efflux transporter n=1 Tax=Rickettsiales endosymbiont of Trichoplax sp. H2 TaxID=2021221 RepID=UPI0012B3F21E|nr:MATE family efflux transporter [Rickettsiales endosymbiont of Trichoplax sp. H2]MSO13730.1 putative multidrug resistance protein NorM [Rickettsiales endosymbiont of Trichoplax sp. H2]